MTKPHKFFERYLDNDLTELTKELTTRYELIQQAKVAGVTELKPNEAWMSSGSVSTMKWREYNVFQFHIEGIRNLYSAISETMKEACEYYDLDFYAEKYMIQGWFNINTAKGGKLNWHDHSAPGNFAPLFHGYYCVNAEPSETHYKLFNNANQTVVNVNKNNRMIISEMGHPHAMGDWQWDGPRITVAYDIMPFAHIKTFPIDQEQHWIPLV
jgi:hypothetical protein